MLAESDKNERRFCLYGTETEVCNIFHVDHKMIMFLIANKYRGSHV